MRVSVADAEDQLPDLVRRAEAGETIILTQDGRPIARPEPIGRVPDRRTRRAVLADVRRSAAMKAAAGPDAAHSQDWLYGEDGLADVTEVPVRGAPAPALPIHALILRRRREASPSKDLPGITRSREDPSRPAGAGTSG